MILCYSCNEWKPGDTAPFAICDDCKAGDKTEESQELLAYRAMETALQALAGQILQLRTDLLVIKAMVTKQDTGSDK